jgi:hypothetical protein
MSTEGDIIKEFQHKIQDLSAHEPEISAGEAVVYRRISTIAL